jgi:cytidylate kinase
LQQHVAPDDAARVAQVVETARITCHLENNEAHILIDDVDPRDHLRDDNVNKSVSRVSSVPRVREIIVEKLRNYASDRDLVMDGRDIGSVVFPDTPYKFYLDASLEVRSQRRAAQGQRDEIAMRDHADSSRRASPLVIAKDAEVIDTSDMGIDDVVSRIIARLKLKGLALKSSA